MDNTEKKDITAELGKYGWNVDNFHHSNLLQSHMFYVRDFRFNSMQILANDISDFEIAKNIPDVSIRDCFEVIGTAMYKLSHQKLLSDDEHQSFVVALIKYTVNSQNYKMWRNFATPDERLHFSLNIYKSNSPKLYPRMITLRPFIFPCDDLMHTSDEALSYSKVTHQYDLKHHPEWFKC
ncbi:hypothetical protein K9692_004705 [Escherichia coli]|nr:hypothetical protein [Escherichia coli]